MDKIKLIWRKHLLPLVTSVSLVGGGVAAYLIYETWQNRREFERELANQDQYKDATRDNNEFYGINWGYRADALIRDKIDSGDIFLIKYQCKYCLSLRDAVLCRYFKTVNTFRDYDSMAFAYRDANGLYVVASQFGRTQIIPYFDFLAQPFLAELSMRKLLLHQEYDNIGERRAFFRLLKKHYNEICKQSQQPIFQKPEEMALQFVKNTGLLSSELSQDDQFYPYIRDFNNEKVWFFKNKYLLDSVQVIRTQSNRELYR